MSTGADPSGRSPAEVFSDLYFQAGWSRHLPHSAIAILGPLTAGATALHDLELMPAATDPELGWESTAWESLHQYTDEELQELRADREVDPDEPPDAEAVMAEESQRRAEQIEEIDQWAAALGVAPVRTLSQLLDFLVACRLVLRTGSGDDVVLQLNGAAPLPVEILPMSEDQRRADDELRWRELHEGTAQAIIDLFDPHGDAPRSKLQTSLQRLSRMLDVDVESAREGVVNLVGDGDFRHPARS